MHISKNGNIIDIIDITDKSRFLKVKLVLDNCG